MPVIGNHLVPLGDTGWHLWRDFMLRSAGFPAGWVLRLCDDELAAAADTAGPGFAAAYTRATERLSAAIRQIAADPLFREAIIWQNRRLVTDCLDKAKAGEPRNVRGRNHEMTIVGYVQRYALKNDTIGFFGPVCWAAWTEGVERLTVEHGAGLLSRRSVYFEAWAIDALAYRLSTLPGMTRWLRPRLSPADLLHGCALYRPDRPALALSEGDADLLSLCDGERTLQGIAAELEWAGHDGLGDEKEVTAALRRLADLGIVILDLEGPIEAWPERTLRARIERVGDVSARREALAELDRLVAARDDVAAAAGDAGRLAAAMDRLNATFEEITGSAPVRRPGQTYAGRTLVYEDTVRDLSAELGASLRAEIAPALGLVLDSVRWLTGRIADEYSSLFAALHRRWCDRHGPAQMPLVTMVNMATPHLFFTIRQLPGPVTAAVADFQARWARVLVAPSEARRVDRDSAALADAVRSEFPAAAPPWATAVHHAPDLMIAAGSVEAVQAGDYRVVLGELHTAFNSLESRVFVEQHPRPGDLLAADAADHRNRRVYLVPPKDWPAVTSRLAPPSALLSPGYTYWTLRTGSVEAPGRIYPLADLYVHACDGRLIVRSRVGDLECDLLEMLGELLSAAAVNAFKPLAPAAHRPRVTIDRLVFARESWTVPVADLGWASTKSEPQRFRAARAWRRDAGLPERVFVKSAAEDKPLFLDFRSIALVNLLAKVIRQAAEASAVTIGVSEMLPDLDELWLSGPGGERYTAELRTIAVDG
jgi:hypothetical protein